MAISLASEKGHEEIVRYLATLPGTVASANNNLAIWMARNNKHKSIVRFY